MKAYEIAGLIEKTAPENLAYEWDNVGFLAGDKNKDVSRVFLTLDTNLSTVREAAKSGADMIVSHHPIFFKPIQNINYGAPAGELVRLLVENDITLYAAHTNMDSAVGGINDALAKLFGLKDAKVIEPDISNPSAGLGRYGKIDETDFLSFVEKTKMLLKTHVRYAGDENGAVKTVAVASGACSELAPAAKALGCDVLITGDMKYHEMLDAYESGIRVIDAGHYPTEICVIDIFADILKDSGLEIIKSTEKDIFNFS